MQGVLLKILYGIGSKLLTDVLFSKLMVYSLAEVSKKTTNTLDDKIVGAVAEGLGIKDYK